MYSQHTISNSHFIKDLPKGRSRFFEVLIVSSIISAFVYISSHYYQRIVDGASEYIEYHQHTTFQRFIHSINVLRAFSEGNEVSLDNQTIYLNERGWPANTDITYSSSVQDQTVEECSQLWNAFSSEQPFNALSHKLNNRIIPSKISLVNNTLCRYEFNFKRDLVYFLGYDISTGKVMANVP